MVFALGHKRGLKSGIRPGLVGSFIFTRQQTGETALFSYKSFVESLSHRTSQEQEVKNLIFLDNKNLLQQLLLNFIVNY